MKGADVNLRGAADGTTWRVAPARYAKDQVAVRHDPSVTSKLKSRGDRIAEALNGRYSGRENAYIMSRTKGLKWAKLLQEGWDAHFFNVDPKKPPPLIPPKVLLPKIFADPQEHEDVLQACRRLRDIAKDLPSDGNYPRARNIDDVPVDELRKSVADMRNMLAVLVAALEDQP